MKTATRLYALFIALVLFPLMAVFVTLGIASAWLWLAFSKGFDIVTSEVDSAPLQTEQIARIASDFKKREL